MSESPNGMVIDGPTDQPIVDSFGIVWRLTADRQVTADGFLDHATQVVLLLAYSNRQVWRQTEDLRWACKIHPAAPWLPAGGTLLSPLNGPNSAQLADIQASIVQFKEDYDGSKMMTSQEVTALAVKVDALASQVESFQQDYDLTVISMMKLLNTVMTVVQQLQTETGKIALDLTHATHVMQPIPSREGP